MGLIDARNYFKHTAQYQKMGIDAFGQTSVSSTNTVVCYVYAEEDKRVIKDDVGAATLRLVGLLPSSVNVSENDKLVTVVDGSGNSILSSGKITQIGQFNVFWGDPLGFHQVFLEVN